jgi:hypothetical protein
MVTDPNGKDWYYTEGGQCLGKDNAKTNYVWSVGSNQYRNEKGVNYISGGTKLKDNNGNFVNHDQFATCASVVKGEASSDSDESLWIAHTANNEAKSQGKSLYDLLTSGYSSADGSKNSLSPTDNSDGANFARSALINVMTGGADPTGGATLWDGTDFLSWGLNSPNGTPHNKFEEYSSVSISKNIYNTYLSNNLSKYPKGRVRYSKSWYNIPASVFGANMSDKGFDYKTGVKGQPGINATGAKGHSIFWKKN